MDSHNKTSEFFDAYAGDFNAIYGTRNTLINRCVNSLFRRSMKLRYERVLSGADPVEGRSVLDIGCGPGHYSVALAKRGAASVVGVDFAPSMIELATQLAQQTGVADRCQFEQKDFMAFSSEQKSDYTVVIGFMDYMADPRAVIDKVLSLTTSKAFFSFPVAGGILGWQRKLRYRSRCELYLYTRSRLDELFEQAPCSRYEIEQIERDFFVTAYA